ncbi:MAG: B12-binding domain-containing radical SAM protein [Treponema sp.]
MNDLTDLDNLNNLNLNCQPLPKIIFTTLLIEKSPQALPLGAACVASSVKQNCHTKNLCSVSLIAFNKEDFDVSAGAESVELIADQIAQELLKRNPFAVGFSIFVWNRIILEKTARILQSHGVKCLAGGPEVTANPKSFDFFDAVVSGEGELKVPALIYRLLTGCEMPDKNENGSALSSLEGISSPYLDGTLDPALYGGALWELARGCPFKCSYCYESKGEKTVRRFPLERIKNELDLFARKKVPQVFVLDPTYNADKKKALELINLIAKKTPDTFYYFEARAEFIDRQLAQAFTKIPCALQIGLQSADENVLKLVNRPFDRKLFVRNIGFLNEAGVVFGLDVIYGLPGDSLKGFKNSVDFAISLYPNNLEIFCLSVLPGTALFDSAKDLALEYEEKPPYHIIRTKTFPAENLATAEKIAVSCSLFYNDGRAVPWFYTVCRALHLKPSDFFEQFYKFYVRHYGKNFSCREHRQIEKIQCEFVRHVFADKNLSFLLPAALDLILLNGAISRKTDTGKSEKVQLQYPAEYLLSEYAMDLQFFVKNVKKRRNVFTT